ncbi:MAG: nucleotidyltransferase domain-containing protein [Candidatus Aenigmatarchaeota archaeon]
MIGFEEQIELLKLVGNQLEGEVECYAIGGTALLFLGLNESTKDIDLVFESEEDRKLMQTALEKMGFKGSMDESEFEIYRKEEAIRIDPILLERDDSRFDLFLKDIISFKLSPTIKKDIKQKHEFDNLTIYVLRPEYILLLKCATDRKGDRVDAKNIVERMNIDWDKIIEEVEWQTENGRKIFTVFLYDFLIELKHDFNADIPDSILKEVRKIGEDKMLEVLEKNENSN